jgi:hypothetical protein
MKWTYSIKNKLIASLALLVLCLLVLLSNYNDRQHSQEVKDTINTMYKDRLVAESYLMNLTVYMYALKEAYNLELNAKLNNQKIISEIFGKIHYTTSLYDKTVFTKEESNKYTYFNAYLKKIKHDATIQPTQKIELVNNALLVLSELSTIQLEESKLIVNKTDKLYESGKLSSDFALAVIVVILIVLQALVFAANSLNVKAESKDINLN